MNNAKKQEQAARTLADPRWQDIVSRNREKDGAFVYSVETTGVYCAPSCGGRRPLPENVRFHHTTSQAEAAGYRACRRCRPDVPPLAERQAGMIAALCQAMEKAETPLSLGDLAELAGVSMYHLHRTFKTVTGVTPKAYMNEVRNRRMRDNIVGKRSITAAVYSSGYGSSSRFYEQAGRRLGMQPKTFRRGGVDASIVFSVAPCWLGFVLVAASEKGVCAISMGEKRAVLIKELHSLFPEARRITGDTEFDALVRQVVSYIEQPSIGLDLPLDVRGTVFQHRVWQALRTIPSGTTVSYAELAKRIGSAKAVRAVARACAANTLAVAIPCHRVVRSDGGLAGYRWDEKRKRALLDREKKAATIE